jgi:hypothetical protein
MFQYAFAKALEKHTNCKILFDISWFDDVKNNLYKNMTVRSYQLNLFNINVPVAERELVEKYKQESKIVETKQFCFDKELFNSDKILYQGDFQNPQYFEEISSQIKEYFTFPKIDKSDEFNNNLLDKIKNCENSVFVHIRRSDYLKPNETENHNTINKSYYEKAMKYIAKRHSNPTFFIFGENCEDFIKTIDIKYPHYYIGNHNSENEESWKDIVLMMACKHAIIANSSFSWWAAWLSDYEGKITIAPIPWLNRGDEIVCKNWIKIVRRQKFKYFLKAIFPFYK